MDDLFDPFGWNERRPDPQIERARRSNEQHGDEINKLNRLWEDHDGDHSDELLEAIQAQSKAVEETREKAKGEVEDAVLGGCLYATVGIVFLIWVLSGLLNS